MAAYYITGWAGTAEATFLLDSGCSKSILPTSLFNRIRQKHDKPIEPVHCQGILADGSKLPLEGLTTITIQLGQQKFEHKFLIANLQENVLLGLDFFTEKGCRIDFRKAQLHLYDEVIKCCDQYGGPLQVGVQTVEATEIPPFSEILIPGRLNQNWNGQLALIEGKTPDTDIRVASSVHHPQQGKLWIRVCNISANTIELPPGKNIATCSQARQALKPTAPMPPSTQLPEVLETLLDQSGLQGKDHAKAKQMLTQNQDVFSVGKFDLGRTGLTRHRIPLAKGAQPVKQRPYRHGPAQEAEIEKQVAELQQQGLISEGKGAWSSPVVLVQKKDGSWRFCVDYRKLNAVTSKDAYPLPRIDDSLDTLGHSRVFSPLDLTSGYCQVELDADAKEKAAFVTRSGLYEWEVLPFGLTSAPSTFERLMETVLRGLHWQTVLIYLDDIIVFAPDVDTHIQRLEEVFSRLRAANLKLKPSKCALFADRVKYLGHIVSQAGVETDEDKVEAIKNWPPPQHKRDLRSFLGTCNYYRRFIHEYSEIARPLNQMSSKNAIFKWTDACQEAFSTLRQRLVSAPILAYPDFNLPFILDTDASAVGLGGILSQVQDGQERVIAYYSKMMSAEERNYCVTRQELLAIVKAIGHFKPQLYGQRFVVRTDHASLTWLLRTTHPHGQLARWMETLAPYNFTIEHRKGRKHNNVDGLSRQVCKDCRQCNRMTQHDIPNKHLQDHEQLSEITPRVNRTDLPPVSHAGPPQVPLLPEGMVRRTKDLWFPTHSTAYTPPLLPANVSLESRAGPSRVLRPPEDTNLAPTNRWPLPPSTKQRPPYHSTNLHPGRVADPRVVSQTRGSMVPQLNNRWAPTPQESNVEVSRPPRFFAPVPMERCQVIASDQETRKNPEELNTTSPLPRRWSEVVRTTPKNIALPRAREVQTAKISHLSQQQKDDPNLRPIIQAILGQTSIDSRVVSAETAQLWKIRSHLFLTEKEELQITGLEGKRRAICPVRKGGL